jgi:hypothetical protein
VDNFEFMAVLNSRNDLIKDFTGFILIHTFFFDDVVKELTSSKVFHDKKEVLGGFDDFIELNDVGMAYKFKDVNFPGHSFDICHIHDFVLLQNLDGDFFTGGNVGH